jgi:putative oxidoreductase
VEPRLQAGEVCSALKRALASAGELSIMKQTDNPMWCARVAKALLLIRILVGWVFVSEGIQKFLFPAQLGVGRFEKIGIPSPHILAPFVGTVEIVCGSLLLIGLFTRLAVIPLLGVISVAIATTKIPMIAKSGMWSMLHEARTDFSMLLGLVFLLITGAGSLSLDARKRR